METITSSLARKIQSAKILAKDKLWSVKRLKGLNIISVNEYVLMKETLTSRNDRASDFYPGWRKGQAWRDMYPEKIQKLRQKQALICISTVQIVHGYIYIYI